MKTFKATMKGRSITLAERDLIMHAVSPELATVQWKSAPHHPLTLLSPCESIPAFLAVCLCNIERFPEFLLLK